MCLKIIENGKQKDVVIREGEVKQDCFSVIVAYKCVNWMFYVLFRNPFIPAVQEIAPGFKKKKKSLNGV